MRKSRALTIRKTSISPSTMLVGILAIGLVIWLIFKNRKSTGQYLNEESWDVQYNSDGLPTKIVIHRNAVRR